MRRIAKSGTRANELLGIVERELIEWRNNSVWLAPDGSEHQKRIVDPTLVHTVPASKRTIQREQEDVEDLERKSAPMTAA